MMRLNRDSGSVQPFIGRQRYVDGLTCYARLAASSLETKDLSSANTRSGRRVVFLDNADNG